MAGCVGGDLRAVVLSVIEVISLNLSPLFLRPHLTCPIEKFFFYFSSCKLLGSIQDILDFSVESRLLDEIDKQKTLRTIHEIIVSSRIWMHESDAKHRTIYLHQS